MDFLPQDPVRRPFLSKELTFKLSLAIIKRWRKSFEGEHSLGEPRVRPYSWATQRVAPTGEIFI